MKKLALLTLMIQISLSVFSQSTPIYTDDFESYAIGDYLTIENPSWWKTWDNLPGSYQDAVISSDHSNSGTLSALINALPNQTDLILKLGDRNVGKYGLDWKMFIEIGNGGYYNLQHFENVGIEWAFDVWFDGDGKGRLNTGGNSFSFTYPQGTWFLVEHYIDMEADKIRLSLNHVFIHEWSLSYQIGTTTGTKQLGGIDFFATTDDGSVPKYFIDDVSFIEFTPLDTYSDDFESYNTGDYIAMENQIWWKTWNNLPGTYQDGILSDAYSCSGTKSVLIDHVSGETDLVMKLGDRKTGKYTLDWNMYVESGKGGYYNIQHFEFVAIEWAFEVWFNGDGSGQLFTGGSSYPFIYPQGTWFQVQHLIDLNSNYIKLQINGGVVHQWPFSYQPGSTTGKNQLGCVDFFAATFDGSEPKYFIDDMKFMRKVATDFYIDNFESFNQGEYIALVNPEWWKTWDNLPGTYQDGLITNDYAYSGNRSVLVDNVPGETDLVLKLGDRTSGSYDLKWMMFIEPGNGGYYNIQHFEFVAIEWAFEVFFDGDGAGQLITGGSYYPFSYPQGTWFQVQHIIDLTNDLIWIEINGIVVHKWPFSYKAANVAGISQLGCVNFYAATMDGSPPKYYIDDIYFQPSNYAVIPLSNWTILFIIGMIALFNLYLWRKLS